jgi:cytoskeletal protein CcmA (bactofilin family)
VAVKNDSIKELNFIGAGTIVEGKIKSPGSIRIDGKIIGEINAGENLAVGNTGDVEGNVIGRNITIGGNLKGTVMAQEKLVFESKAIVKGDIRAGKLVIDEGAVFDGKCTMSEAKSAPKPAAPEVKY